MPWCWSTTRFAAPRLQGADATKLFAIPVREAIGRAKSVPADQYKEAYAQMRADMARQIDEIAAQGGDNA